MRNLNNLSNNRPVCLVPNPNSKSSAILGISFSLTQNGLCVVEHTGNNGTIQRGKKLRCALSLNTEFKSLENLKRFKETECPFFPNQECILNIIKELKSLKKLCSMKPETGIELPSCSSFPERPKVTG